MWPPPRAVPLVSVADDGVACGSRHNYAGSAGNQMCLKNAAGAQGGVRQGGQNSNDMVVPLRRSHAGYNGLPSRNNLLRSRDDRIIPCAKCKYAKSCFMEAGVAECPSGYHKMYTGYLFGGHQGHHGSNDRICIDKNPADNDCEVYPQLVTWPGSAKVGCARICARSRCFASRQANVRADSPHSWFPAGHTRVADDSSDPGSCFSCSISSICRHFKRLVGGGHLPVHGS